MFQAIHSRTRKKLCQPKKNEKLYHLAAPLALFQSQPAKLFDPLSSKQEEKSLHLNKRQKQEEPKEIKGLRASLFFSPFLFSTKSPLSSSLFDFIIQKS